MLDANINSLGQGYISPSIELFLLEGLFLFNVNTKNMESIMESMKMDLRQYFIDQWSVRVCSDPLFAEELYERNFEGTESTEEVDEFITEEIEDKDLVDMGVCTKKLVFDPKHKKLGVLGEATTVTPMWLGMQRDPFPDDADLHRFFPVTGGAMVVDRNTAVEKEAPTQDQIDQLLGRGKYSFNPAADVVKEILGIGNT